MVPRGKAEHLPRMAGTEPVGTEPVGWVSAGSPQGLCRQSGCSFADSAFQACHHLLFGKGTAEKRAWLRNDMLTQPC